MTINQIPKHDLRRVSHDRWSIAMYAGPSPLQLEPVAELQRPILDGSEVTDIAAHFVADPFMLQRAGHWYLFFEILNADNGLGEIGLAQSADGLHWRYERVVLREPFHLSYPYVFEWGGEVFMTPETLDREVISLYRAVHFPTEWVYEQALVTGAHADPSPFYFDGKWWMFACPAPYLTSQLQLYTAAQLTGPWQPHPQSPLIAGNVSLSRPAGRVIDWQGNLLHFAQDCYPHYGYQVRAFRIDQLDAAHYSACELSQSPILTASGQGWNAAGMHHIDAHQLADGSWLACVDGQYHQSPEGLQS